MLLQDKVAVLSGVGEGLGRAAAHLFAQEGCAVVLVARSAERIRSIAQEVERQGGRAIAVPGDVTRGEDCRHIADIAKERFGGTDILVNIAFVLGQTGLLMDTQLEDDHWSDPFEICVKGSLRLTKALLPQIEARKGAVVMVNTVSTRTYHPQVGVYAIAKGALQTASRMLAEELGPKGVRLNTVTPGYIDGPPLEGAFALWAKQAGSSPQEIREQITAKLPLKYIPTSLDVAHAVLFLASDRARGITGATLDVNGGEYIAM